MEEVWIDLFDYPEYAVSSHGRVRNTTTNRLKALTRNQQGIVMVNFHRGNGQAQRSVALLVASEFIEQPYNNTMGTISPIQLDGDRENCCVENLAWRPRWFAVAYHKQFKPEERAKNLTFRGPIMDVETEEIYESSWDAAIKNGLLDKDIYLSILNHTIVFPTFQKFVVVEE